MAFCKRRVSFKQWIAFLLFGVICISGTGLLNQLDQTQHKAHRTSKKHMEANTTNPKDASVLKIFTVNYTSMKNLFKNDPTVFSKASPKIHSSVFVSAQTLFKETNAVENSQHSLLGSQSHYHAPVGYYKDQNSQNDLERFRSFEKIPHRQTKAVIVITNYRSGSSFFGEFLNQHPDVFYVFEPLIVASSLESCEPRDVKLEIVKKLSQCIIPDFSAIYHMLDGMERPVMNRNLFVCVKKRFCFPWFTKEIDENARCPPSQLRNKPHYNWKNCDIVNTSFARSVCRRKKVVAIKLIRFCDILDLEELVENLNIDVKVVHLIRDPRGIANSRRIIDRNIDLSKSMKFTCDRQASNVNTGLYNTARWLQGRYKMFRYEDAAVAPMQTAQSLYDFLDLPFEYSVKKWIEGNTGQKEVEIKKPNAVGNYLTAKHIGVYNNIRKIHSSDFTDPWSHKRVSKTVVLKWQKYLTYSKVKDVEKECQEIMELAGYVPVNSAEQYRNKSYLYFTNTTS